MELTLLGTVAVAAFVVGGAIVMLVSAFRRTVELRGALIQAIRRIETLESALATGAFAAVAPPQPTPALETEPPPILPRPETVAQRTQTVSVEEIAAQADASDKVEPPRLSVVAVIGAAASLAALAAAQAQALSGGAGVILALAVSAAMLGVAEWRRRRLVVDAPQAPTPNRGVALTALLSVAIAAMALLYGRWLNDALPPQTAAFATGALAVVAALLSMRMGGWLLAAAIAIGALAPAQSPIGAVGAWGQYAFLFAFTTLIMELSRRREEAIWAWAAALVALFWGANAVVIGGAPFNVGAAGLYLSGLIAVGLFYAWPWAESLPFPRFWTGVWNEPMLFGHGMLALAAALLAMLLIAHPTPVAFAGAALLALAAVSVAAGALQPGLWLAPTVAALAGAAVIALWGPAGAVADPPGLALVASAMALLFAIGGGASMAGAKDPQPGAWIAALAPVAVFVAAFARIGDFGGASLWIAAALTIAAINIVAHIQLRRRRSPAAPAFASGAVFAAAAALTAAAPAPYQPLGLALALPLIGLADHWRSESGLRHAAIVVCMALTAALTTPRVLVESAAAPALIFVLFAPSALAAFGAAALFARRGRPTLTSQVCMTFGVLIAALGASLAARHAFTGGAIAAPYASLDEAGLNTLTWLGAATLLAWRLGPRPPAALFIVELAMFTAAAAHALFITGILLNPWWGATPGAINGATGFSSIELAFLAPALIAFAYALLRQRHRLEARAGVALGLGLTLLFLAVMLELRRLFHGQAMADAAIAPTEAWVYSLAMLGFAALVMALGVERGLRTLRHASVALALAALAKMAFSDIGALDGLTRLGAFLAIAGAAGGGVYLYRRFMLSPTPAQPKLDPNLVPPG